MSQLWVNEPGRLYGSRAIDGGDVEGLWTLSGSNVGLLSSGFCVILEEELFRGATTIFLIRPDAACHKKAILVILNLRKQPYTARVGGYNIYLNRLPKKAGIAFPGA